ncbi:glycosyltransferase [Rasiella sp. SM2506]|uniref:glycosyltransferase n=1 Tax=Rasiella sp. SM2506 TaxID=3423914 RepID=UPI003D78B4EC
MQNTHKKICIVSICLAKGGAERSCAMLSEMLVTQGYEVHIAILTDEVRFSYSGTLFNLGKLKKENETISGRFKRLLTLRAYLKKHAFDVIIDHRSKNDYYRELFYHKVIYKGFKKIYVVHSSNPSLYLTQKPKEFAKLYNKNMVTVGVSNYISKTILPSFGIENSVTIHNAFDPAWGESQRRLPGTITAGNYILSYGRIDDPVKDFTFLLNAYTASHLWKEGIQLVILGDGDDKKTLQQFAQILPSASQIVFLPNQSPFHIIANAQFVTLTSRFEGFPMVLVESLSLGVPVVSLDIVSGPSEIIEHEKNGLLIAKRDVSLFAEAMQRMSTDSILREQCQENARASVAQFSTEEIAKQWNQLLYNELR